MLGRGNARGPKVKESKVVGVQEQKAGGPLGFGMEMDNVGRTSPPRLWKSKDAG